MKESKGLYYGAITARILLGLAYFAGGLSYFLMAELPLDAATPGGAYMMALMATGFFLPVLKVVETLGGLMLFTKRWTPLSLIVLAPVTLQIFLYGAFLDSQAIGAGIVMGALHVFLGWYNWDKYAALFEA